MNRGLARRTVFETRLDMRRFLAEIARCVRSKRLEVHAFTLLSTHYHLLVQSPRGELAEAMRRTQNAYVRWFNRSRKRDGPLFRGRYCSRRVTDDEYRLAVVRYIDGNPLEARIATRPELYPYGSAYHYARHRRPPWLECGWVENEVRRLRRRPTYEFADYGELLHSGLTECPSNGIDRRLRSASRIVAEPESILGSAPPAVLAWMQLKAQLGDGTRPGLALCDPLIARRVVDESRSALGTWVLTGSGPAVDGWRNAEIALLRLLCGASLQEIAARCGISKSGVAAATHRHRYRLAADPEYADRMVGLAQRTLSMARGASLDSAPPTHGERPSTLHELT